MKRVLGIFCIVSSLLLTCGCEGMSNCKNGKCSAITKAGNPCKNCAQKGSIYCGSHN